jgi:hypothetical protein
VHLFQRGDGPVTGAPWLTRFLGKEDALRAAYYFCSTSRLCFPRYLHWPLMKNAFARVLSVAFLSCVLVQTGCTSGSDNSGSGGGSTPVVPVAVNPTVSSVSPAMVTAGAASTTLTVTGTGFTSSTTVQVGSAAETTTYSSSQRSAPDCDRRQSFGVQRVRSGRQS